MTSTSALAQQIEAPGWHSYFVIEHQNSPLGRITAPTVYLTAVARATQRAAHRRDDVATAVLSSDAAGAGSGDARPALARAGRVRHRHRRARARVHPLGRRLLSARRDRGRSAGDRQDGLDAGRGHLRRQVLPLRRGAAAAQAVSRSRIRRSGRRCTATRRSSSRRATTTTSRRTSTPTR